MLGLTDRDNTSFTHLNLIYTLEKHGVEGLDLLTLSLWMEHLNNTPHIPYCPNHGSCHGPFIFRKSVIIGYYRRNGNWITEPYVNPLNELRIVTIKFSEVSKLTKFQRSQQKSLQSRPCLDLILVRLKKRFCFYRVWDKTTTTNTLTVSKHIQLPLDTCGTLSLNLLKGDFLNYDEGFFGWH